MSDMRRSAGRRPAFAAYPLSARRLRGGRAGARRRPAPRALERTVPLAEQPAALLLPDRRLVAGGLAPHLADCLRAPDPAGDPRQVGGAERGRLGDLRNDDL